MITHTYTVASKTESYRDYPSVELQCDPVPVTIGKPCPAVDLPSYITLRSPEAVKLKLGDRVRLTLEKLDG